MVNSGGLGVRKRSVRVRGGEDGAMVGRFYAQKERVMTVECHHAFQFPTLQLASSLLAKNV